MGGALAPGGTEGPKDGKKDQHRQMVLVGAAVAGVVLTYLLYRAQKKTAATGTTTVTTPTNTTGTVSGDSVDPNAEAAVGQLGQDLNTYNQSNQSAIAGLQALISSLGAEITQMQASPSPSPSPSPAPPTTATPALPAGYNGWKQVVGPDGQVLDVVGGYNGSSQYSGFEVGNGAPVYAQNPGGQFTLGLPSSSLQPGATFAVPTQYLGDVNTSNPVVNGPGF